VIGPYIIITGPYEGIRQKIDMKRQLPYIVRILLCIIGLAIIVGLSRSLVDLWKRRDIVVERKTALEKVEAENVRLKKALLESQTPEFIEKQAREKLNLAKPDEVVVIVAKATSSGVLNQEGERVDQKPSWRVWWELFF
jgi:cell division protein FtsB